MKYKILMQYQNDIRKLRADIARAEDSLLKITQALSAMPKSGNVENKVEKLTVDKITCQEELAKKEQEYSYAVASLPTDTLEGKCIDLKLKGLSWKRIATVVYHDPNKEQAVIKSCKRFVW
ncbi:MAG: hypothetical protein ACI4RM_02535 [Ruminococcus sp.]